MNQVLGLITARGGSKGIPRKNIANLAGKPLIAWTIQAALASQRLSHVVVSTDDDEIAGVARAWGAEVPFLRPAELSGDRSAHMPVVLHAVRWLQEYRGLEPEWVVLLQPTCPFRTAQDIDAAIDLAWEKGADSVISVCPARDHPYLSKAVADDGRLLDFIQPPEGYLPRQSLPPVYTLNGAIYVARREPLLTAQTFYFARTYAYVMPPERSLDIDTPWDLIIADLLLKDKEKRA